MAISQYLPAYCRTYYVAYYVRRPRIISVSTIIIIIIVVVAVATIIIII